MSKKKVDEKSLDYIVKQMITTVDQSKNEIFKIGEQCRQDYESLVAELSEIKIDVQNAIERGDALEIKSKLARKHLSDVSRRFDEYTEEQVRGVYENANHLHTDLTVTRETEKQLRKRRDELERRLTSLQCTVERAETLVSQITIVSNYLDHDIREIGEVLEDAKVKQAFGLRIIEAQEEERQRLSREIHDGPAQLLANVLIRSDLAEKVHRQKGPEDSLKEIKSLKEMIRAALQEVRRIIYDLRPMALDDLGLIPTLEKYLQSIEEFNPQTVVRFVHIGPDQRLLPKYEVAIFRLIQESVQNALKHANAKEIQVKIETNETYVTVVVSDDGSGFDPNLKKNNSFGLIGMKERVSILEGEINILSNNRKGTTILIKIPLME
ncbi:MAG TPA: sensor histidine kinase [Pseudogracilibacillus sp.]|nr:sensor histidine kinase [Pseudogracilibacillus sp.]